MSEIIVLTDEALRLALLQAEEAEYLHLRPGEAEEMPLPPELLRRLRPLLSDPFGDRRRRRRALGRSAAAVALAAALTAGTVLAVSPEARAWARNLIVEILEEYTTIRFVDETGGQAGHTGQWAPAWLPEGYVLEEIVNLGTRARLTYTNGVGNAIFFQHSTAGTISSFNNEHHEEMDVWINDHPGYLLRAVEPGYRSSLTWYDQASGTAFSLLAELSPEELIRIAESVQEN